MTAEPWEWDDPEVPPHDVLMRRILRKPLHRVIPDAATRQIKVLPAAITLHRGSGCSTQSELLLPRTGVGRVEIYDWDRYNGIEFSVEAVRATALAGVIYKADPDDDRLGEAHALVRAPTANPDKPTRRDIQAAIAEICRIMPEDPNPPS